ncbi:anti-sigma factor [Mesorhizobium sp. CC13]|uniref:anti-sigma factor family protein n=1 Tax=Mesorhizobium sp. CC13 TaxID=3029194 RepID=UPI00326606E3
MSSHNFDDETLMAFADGELDAETSARVEAAMETDDELVMRVASFIESRAQAAAALKPLIDEAVPEALTRAVEKMIEEKRASETAPARKDNVVAFGPAARPVRSSWILPLAASLAAAVFGLGGYLAGQANAPQPSLAFAAIADPEMLRVLDAAPSGSQSTVAAGAVKLVSSFRDGSGALCREFELAEAAGGTTVTVACRAQQSWSVRLAVAAAASGGADYAPAGAAETVDAFLATIGAGAPLSEADEKAALARP